MGEKFGNYEIIRKLAAGGMAEVLLVKQRGMGGFERLVCLKRILPHLSAQEDFLKMFQDEARIAANLVHPNIGQIYDIAQEGDDYYIAMEYIRGEDLRRVYNQEVGRGHTLRPEIAAHIMMGAAAGLDYAHRHAALDGTHLGIVHRDVSPQNILITYDGYVKLIDFGVAKAAGKLIQTRSGVLKGKYSYMSPEQASGDPVDGRTDIFAMGVTLYEITTGTRLFKRENELETLHAVIACNVPPPSDVITSYDRGLEAIVLRALAYNPEDRFATAGELERALERYLLAGGYSTSATILAEYMHNLFAEKLADEALFGGPPWSEPATPSQLAAPPKEDTTVDVTLLPENTLADAPPELPARQALPDDWDSDDESLEQTASNLRIEPEVLGQEELEEELPAAVEDNLSAEIPLRPHLDTLQIAPRPQRQQVQSWQIRLGISLFVMLVGAVLLGIRHRRQHMAATRQIEFAAATKVRSDAELYVDPPVDPADPHAYLTVSAPIPMEITLGNRYLGDTPLRHLAMEPGSYRLRLESKADGVIVRRSIRLEAGTSGNLEVLDQRGSLSMTGKPWAWVRVGLRPATETPARLDLMEGEYHVVFECPDGRRHTETVLITAGRAASVGMNCSER